MPDQDVCVLAQLFEKAQQVCVYPLDAEYACDRCEPERIKACGDALVEICVQIRAHLLAHFEREEARMNSLPGNHSVKAHCAAHRRQHVNFSTRFNLTVTRFDAGNPRSGLTSLSPFIVEWAGIASRYDRELLDLLKVYPPRQ